MMTIQTKFDFGDTIANSTVKGVHIYVSDDGVQTERYYLGKEKWYTLKTKTAKRRRCKYER